MFDRFTDRAREVLKLARGEAQKLNHPYIGTEHLLLGLATEGKGIGAIVLRNLKVDPARLREEIVEIAETAGLADGPMPGLPYTPRGKKALESAVEEARELGHHYVGTEHLLLGLIRENGCLREDPSEPGWEEASQSLAARLLVTTSGLKLEDVRKEVMTLVAPHTVGVAAAEDESYEREFKEKARGYALAFAPPGSSAEDVERHVENMWSLQQKELRHGTALRYKPGEDPIENKHDFRAMIAGMFKAGARRVVVDQDPQRPGMFRVYTEASKEEAAAAQEAATQDLIAASNYTPSVGVTLMFSDELHREAWLAKNGFFDHPDPRRVQAKKLDYQRRRDSAQLFYKVGPLPASSEAFKPETF